VIDWWWWLDPRCRRRAAAADKWWRGHGRSNSGEDRGGTGQRVARAASLGPRGCAETVGWLGDRVGSRARRWLSDEPAARVGQQASVGSTGGPSGLRSGTRLRGKVGGGGVHRVAPMMDGGGSVLTRGEDRPAL
jgi:hypothetical protein